MANLFADAASYQPTDVAYMQHMVTQGVKGIVIKLTEGTGYVSNKAKSQISSAQRAGLVVSVYHYARWTSTYSAVAEAQHFISVANSLGLPKSTVMVADVEDPAQRLQNAGLHAFMQRLALAGYKNVVVYTMASWIWSGIIDRAYPLWVANYGTSSGLANPAAWQFTSTFRGESQDMSYDYTGIFTGKIRKEADEMDLSKLAAPRPIWCYGVAYITPKAGAQVYADKALTKPVKGKVLKHQTAWLFSGFSGGAIDLGAGQYISTAAAVTRINPLAVGTSLTGAVVVSDTADLYTQAKTANAQPGIKQLPKGSRWKAFGASKDKHYINLGGSNWAAAAKLKIML